MRKKENGITLIALVVTIVVLAIITGISINSLVSKKGTINETNEITRSSTKRKHNRKNRVRFI